MVDQANRTNNTMKMFDDYAENADASAIILMDGPPDLEPNHDVRWVNFCSPNEEWMGQFAKAPDIDDIYMPVWTLEELQGAAYELHCMDMLTPIDADELSVFGVEAPTADVELPDVIDYRFRVFGGVVHACFERDRELLVKFFTLQQEHSADLTVDQVVAALRSVMKPLLHHSILHYVPERYHHARFRLASESIERLVGQRIADLYEREDW